MENTRELIAENIAKHRKLCGLTQSELAEKLNYSDKAISKWERGESLPDILILKDIATIFGIKVDDLFSKKEPKQKGFRKFFLRVYTDKFLITTALSIMVWLFATIIFVGLTLFSPETPKVWLCFIFAIPTHFLALLLIWKVWKSDWYNFCCFSLLTLGIALSIHLAFDYANLWMLFILCIPIIALAYLWFVSRNKVFRRKK